MGSTHAVQHHEQGTRNSVWRNAKHWHLLTVTLTTSRCRNCNILRLVSYNQLTLCQKVHKWGVGFLTLNKIRFKHFVLLLLCVCVHNLSVSQWKQYELQIWSSWRNIIFWKWKAPQNSTPENGHTHGEYFRCFHSRSSRIKTLPQSPICTEEISLYTVHIKSIITKFCFCS